MQLCKFDILPSFSIGQNLKKRMFSFTKEQFLNVVQKSKQEIINDFRIIMFTVERISVCNVIENLMEYGIHCLPCSHDKDVIDLLP